jgi:hypothetical protein
MTASPTSLPTPQQFFIEYPLYEVVIFDEPHAQEGWDIKYFEGTFDSYCPECGSHSIFSRTGINKSYPSDVWVGKSMFGVELKCTRTPTHLLYFLFKIDGWTMQKIGQFPSLASLNLYDVKKYAPVLLKAAFQELTKAIGLAAHGVGVGSFVYLRRIFEGLVEQAHIAAKTGTEWDEEQYSSSRMGEKIALLAAFLPAFLVENKTMYGILSKGIHELTEEECLAAFPVVKVGIEIILDAKIEEAAVRKKLETARLAIQKLASSVASPSGN